MTDAATAPASAAEPVTGKVGGVSYTLNDSAPSKPSEQLTAAADSRIVVKDERGREIVLRKPKVLDQYHIVEALGDSATNQVYMGMVMPLLFIVSIDNIPVAKPRSKGEIEALINRLDDDGVTAVMEGVAANFGAPNDNEDVVKNA